MYWMPESIGSGGAVLDYDNDGRMDIYLIHSAPTNHGARNQLFHQESDGRFRNVSTGSGLDVSGPGMGAAVGDVNNDGRPDVLLTEFGRARLFINRGEGRFYELGRECGIDNTRWATSAAFLDYDRDGWLDLVIANYVDYTATTECSDAKGQREYCGPQGMQGTSARLFHNRGNQNEGVRFEDVTASSRLATKVGAGLGVLCADFNGDHWPDIFIADDGMANRLFINQRDGSLSEEALQRGLAYNAFGAAVANMGIAHGDVDGNGLFDLFIPHVSWEQHALWMQSSPGLFQDKTIAAGLTGLSLRGTGFGALLADFDGDGDLDLAFANGRIRRAEATPPFLKGMDPFWQPYAQPNQLLSNDGSGRFREISGANPTFCGESAVGRGLACLDFDNDGRLDLLVINIGAPVRLLRNVSPNHGHWLLVRAIDPALGDRDAYGSEIILSAGSRRWQRLVQPGYSFLVSNDPRAHFGLGTASQYDRIEVRWPDGSLEIFAGGKPDRVVVLQKGTGTRP
jgi:hypothetical protein